MDVMFEIVGRQKLSATFPTAHAFGEAGGYIGRSDECEWMLPDRSKKISRKHALITYDGGAFYLEDVSSNGVFLSLGHELLGKGKRHRIEHGEGFVIGDYSLMAKLLNDPKSYVASAHTNDREDILSYSQPLSLNPLTAMDQEEEIIARQRLGDYDNLLGRGKTATVLSSDHTDPRISTLQSVVAVPASQEILPEDWDSDPEEDNAGEIAAPVTVALPTTPSVPASRPPSPVQQTEVVAVPETDIFFRALGFAEAPGSQEERARILELSARLLVTAVTGMVHALHNRTECKNELRLPVTVTGFEISNNPLKFSPTTEAALSTLLGPTQKGVLSPVESMREGFDNLHSHHMGLLAGARAVARASLDKVAPQAVEARLDANGPVRLNRANRLWHTFIRMHHALRDDQEGFAALFLQDFARAYEVQGRTLNPSSVRASKGEQS
jgi:type VI secretion system protein ImpI